MNLDFSFIESNQSFNSNFSENTRHFKTNMGTNVPIPDGQKELKDVATEKSYNLYVLNGKLVIEEV